MIENLRRLLAPLQVRVANMVSRAFLKGVDDSKKMQLVQLELLADEVRDEIEHFQNYGFTSHPKVGAEAAVIFVGGKRDHGLAIAVDDRRYRICNLADGEVAVYNHTGASIVLKASGDIEITPASGQTARVVGLAELNGNTEAAIKGTTYITAESTFLTALGTYFTGIKPIADPTNVLTPVITAAVTAFATAGTASKSSTVKLGST